MILILYRVSPGTNAVSERSALTIRRIKSCLLRKMTQEWLNYAMLLLIHNESTDKLDLIDIKNIFLKEMTKDNAFFWRIL